MSVPTNAYPVRPKCCLQCGQTGDPTPLKGCTRCKSARYCSAECQKAHWPVHKPTCRPFNADEVWGIELLSEGAARRAGAKEDSPGARFRHVLLQRGHPAFAHAEMCPAFAHAEMCPATAACGIPVRIYSAVIHARQVSRDHEDDANQPAVYMRIEVDDGLAPMHWQMNNPGTCILFREDQKLLTKETAETLWQWHSMLLSDGYGYPEEDGWAPFSTLPTPASWQLFSRKYYEEQGEKGRQGFNDFFAPL